MRARARAGDLIDGLVERYNPKDLKVRPTRFHIVVGEESRDVVVGPSGCRVEESSGDFDVEIQTDARTWRRIFNGQLSGIEGFADGNIEIRGSIDKSLLFEAMFDRPDAGGFRYALERVSLGGRAISALVAGDESAPPLLLIHGLGASKASWLPVVPALARHHRIYAIDLPGFGSSSKPRGKYTAPWFADHVFRFMDMVDLESTFVAGNSLGGRVTMEMAMMEPERVRGIACLCPASAFSYRPGLPIVKLLRPEMGFVVARLPRTYIRDQLKQLFCDPGRIQEDWYDAAIDDFLGRWKTVRGRLAFFAALRNIYLDEPEGEAGFWARLTDVKVPSLFVYGRRDVLITHNFSQRVRKHLPSAKVQVWNDCGHVPQLEHPERTVNEMTKFFAAVETRAKAV
ncbi:MAG: alpha/beta fold hydrolase [Actinomycetota bacterium]|nr:alpha/beta fold hydrolase [Actinomycetota bacterium]